MKNDTEPMNRPPVGTLLTRCIADIPYRTIPTSWGRWHHRKRTNTLEFWKDYRTRFYSIPLDEASISPAECLDWIFQVSRKAWMTNDDRGDLLQAFQDLIHPQATLCSWGACRADCRRSKEASPREGD